MKVFVIMTDEGDLIGVAANKKTAIRMMTEFLIDMRNKHHWFEDDYVDYTLEDAIADVKSDLQADGYIYAEPADFWSE